MGKKGRIKSRCGNCQGTLFLNDGHRLYSKTKIKCPKCGYENPVKIKTNGKIVIGKLASATN